MFLRILICRIGRHWPDWPALAGLAGQGYWKDRERPPQNRGLRTYQVNRLRYHSEQEVCHKELVHFFTGVFRRAGNSKSTRAGQSFPGILIAVSSVTTNDRWNKEATPPFCLAFACLPGVAFFFLHNVPRAANNTRTDQKYTFQCRAFACRIRNYPAPVYPAGTCSTWNNRNLKSRAFHVKRRFLAAWRAKKQQFMF